MKRKLIALLLCIVCVVSLCFPVAADDDGYSAIVSDIDKTCPTCGATLHASWGSTSGAEVELEISDTGKVKIPAGAGAFARIHLRCSSCGYEKTETRLLGLDFGAEKPGKLVQAPSGIGRKDLHGYNDDSGTPSINSQGQLIVVPEFNYYRIYSYNSSTRFAVGNYTGSVSNKKYYDVVTDITSEHCNILAYTSSSYTKTCLEISYKVVAPVNGYYTVPKQSIGYNDVQDNYLNKMYSVQRTISSDRKYYSKGQTITLSISGDAGGNFNRGYSEVLAYFIYPKIICEPIETTVNQYNKLSINNNTWNGNIYVDNSNNLTYIYPQYTTVNEKNETVTNISNTPIIYNNETKQYYTYDQTTKNYYYITYNSDPAPSPTPTPDPTDKPGGSISTPETGKPGNSSGSSWWDKLLSKIGDAIIDGLLGAVSAVLKLIFKLLSTLLSWIIWAVSRVFDLLPFLPPGLGGLLVGGVVVCFVIGIIKFIRG